MTVQARARQTNTRWGRWYISLGIRRRSARACHGGNDLLRCLSLLLRKVPADTPEVCSQSPYADVFVPVLFTAQHQRHSKACTQSFNDN